MKYIRTFESYSINENSSYEGVYDIVRSEIGKMTEEQKKGLLDEAQKIAEKQTAVEWLAEQMLHPESHNPYIEQALEMEKEQIKNEREEAYNNGYANGQKDAYTN